MAFNGSGVFNRVHDWTNDAAARIKIVSSRHDENDDDIAQGLSNALCRDGQSTVTADISLSTHKLTNVAAPTADTDAATKGYVDGPRSRTNGVTISGAGSPNGMLTFSSMTGTQGIAFSGADLSWLARLAGTPAGSQNRLALNNKPDGSGTDVAVFDDAGNASVAGSMTAVGPFSTSASVTAAGAIQSNSGQIISQTPASGASPSVSMLSTNRGTSYGLWNATDQVLGFGTCNPTGVPASRWGYLGSGGISVGGAVMGTDGNVSGSVWDQWGHHDAISAISAQIEARASAYANNKVAVTQMQRVGNTYSGNVGDQNGWQCPAGTVIVGYARVPGTSGQVYGLYYMTLQIYDNINGWRNMGG